MKIHCHIEDLSYGTQTVSRAVSVKNTLPILSGIMMQTEEQGLILRATDLEMAIECHIPAMVEEAGAVVVPGKNFFDLVRCLDEGDIELFSEENSFDLAITFGESVTKFRGMDPAEFPALPPVTGDISGAIAAPVFRNLVREVAFAAAADEIRPVFSGILLDIKENYFVMVATDTHRLAKTSGVWQGMGTAKVIIPARTMVELARLASDDHEMVQIRIGKNQIIFQIGGILFISRLINGQYPPYQEVIPKEEQFTSMAIIQTKIFRQEMERAAVLARGNNYVVKFTFLPDRLEILASAQDIGDMKSRLPILYQGEEIHIAYNIRYIADVLKAIDTEEMIMKLTGPFTPAVIVPKTEAGTENEQEQEYLYLLLPVRV